MPWASQFSITPMPAPSLWCVVVNPFDALSPVPVMVCACQEQISVHRHASQGMEHLHSAISFLLQLLFWMSLVRGESILFLRGVGGICHSLGHGKVFFLLFFCHVWVILGHFPFPLRTIQLQGAVSFLLGTGSSCWAVGIFIFIGCPCHPVCPVACTTLYFSLLKRAVAYSSRIWCCRCLTV